MFKVINGLLVKCDSNDKVIYLPDNVKYLYGNIFSDNVECIIGNNLEKVYNFNNSNIRILSCNNLKKITNSSLTNLEKIELNNSVISKNNNILPSSIKINDNTYNYSNCEKELKKISNLYNLNYCSENSNIIYLNNNKKEYNFGNKDIINYITKVDKVISLIPKKIMDIISEYKIFIIDIYMFLDKYYIPGITYNNIKTSIICHSGVFELIHEIGHMVDYELNCSNTIEFEEIYNMEKDKIYTLDKNSNVVINHIKSSKEEFFAEIFKKYIINKEMLENECIMSKKYLDEIFCDKIKIKE